MGASPGSSTASGAFEAAWVLYSCLPPPSKQMSAPLPAPRYVGRAGWSQGPCLHLLSEEQACLVQLALRTFVCGFSLPAQALP